MGGKNKKLKEQKGLDQKRSSRQKNSLKEILQQVKRTILKVYGWKKFTYIKINTYKQYTGKGAKRNNYVSFIQLDMP